MENPDLHVSVDMKAAGKPGRNEFRMEGCMAGTEVIPAWRADGTGTNPYGYRADGKGTDPDGYR